jgi:hypothetical protein
MKKIIFKENNKKKLKLENAIYASTKNANKVNFNAVEIFDVEELPTTANINHSEDSTFDIEWDLSTKKKEIKDGIAYFSCTAIIDNEEVVENHEKVNGLSPEVYGGEYFEKDGQIFYGKSGRWEKTGIILDPETPAMEGANNIKKTVFSTNAKIFAKSVEEEGEEKEKDKTDENETKELKQEMTKLNDKIDNLMTAFSKVIETIEEKEEEKEEAKIKAIEDKLSFAKIKTEITNPSLLKQENAVNTEDYKETLKKLI